MTAQAVIHTVLIRGWYRTVVYLFASAWPPALAGGGGVFRSLGGLSYLLAGSLPLRKISGAHWPGPRTCLCCK
jgi:hypothetical protein